MMILSGSLLILAVATLFLVVLVLVAGAILALRFLPQIRLALKLMHILPELSPVIRVAAGGLRAAAGLSVQVGSAACAVGQGLKTAGGVVEGAVVPVVSLNDTSLWEALQKIPLLPLPDDPPGGFLDYKVLKTPSVTMGSLPLNSSVSNAGEEMISAAGFLGSACPSADPLPAEPPEDSLAHGFIVTADALDAVAALLDPQPGV